MKQNEATPDRPFYSVAYQYKANPYTLWSCHKFGRDPLRLGSAGRTMHGTDDLALAKRTADACVKSAGISFAQVDMTTDCYNHATIYTVNAETP